MVNQHGLQRGIPDPIKREIRQRSKFDCVVCRSGLFNYEHIEPEGAWTICIDGMVADFVGNSEEVRFKSGVFRAIQEDGVWEVVPDRLDTHPQTLVERELKLRSFPNLF